MLNTSVPLRRRVGFLNALDDLLHHLGHQIQRYLPELLSIALVLLEGSMLMNGHDSHILNGDDELDEEEEDNDNNDGDGVQGMEEATATMKNQGTKHTSAATKRDEDTKKEIRTRCIRLIAAVLERFPGSIDYTFLWPRLFEAIQPLKQRIAMESSANKPPALVELCVALCSSSLLIPALLPGDGDSARSPGSELLGCCIDVLSAPACAEPTRNALLGLLEAVLDDHTAEEVDGSSAATGAMPVTMATKLLAPYLPSLLRGLQAIVMSVWQHGTAQRNHLRVKRLRGESSQAAAIPGKKTARRALAILERLASEATAVNLSMELTEAILPLIRPQEGRSKSKRGSKMDEELVTRSVLVLSALWQRLASAPSLDNDSSDGMNVMQSRVVAAIPYLAGTLSTRPAREAICTLYGTLTAHAPKDLQQSSSLLSGLNAWSVVELDEPDYDVRIASYRKLTPTLWSSISIVAGAPLVQHCARDLRNNDDLALRHAASQAMMHLITAAAAGWTTSPGKGSAGAALQGEATQKPVAHAAVSSSLPARGVAPQDTGNSASGSSACLGLVQRHLFPRLVQNIAASHLAVRQEHLSLLRQIGLTMPEIYFDIQPLTETDEEIDFWLNVAHLQLHRRARAFSRLTKMLLSSNPSSPAVPLSVCTSLLMPLMQQAIVEGRAADEGGHEAKQSEKDKESNVVDAAIRALSAMAATLPWVQYQQLLGQYLRLMGKTTMQEGHTAKHVLRAVCAVIDAFHFLGDEHGKSDDGGDVLGVAMVDKEGSNEPAGSDGSDSEDADGSLQQQSSNQKPKQDEIYRMLSKRVIPELRSQLVHKDVVRAPVAHALVKVLKLLPRPILHAQLPRMLQLVANLLKLRMQHQRDDARVVFVSMMKELGPEFLIFALEVLRAALPDRGFTAHVMGYTTHAMLEGLVPAARNDPGPIDECLPQLLSILESDLFGDIADAKEVDAFASSYKEAKKCKAYETYQLLSSVVTFSTHITELLSLVCQHLHEASKPKIRTKLTLLLQHASRGALTNVTAKPKDFCEFVYAVVNAGIAAEEAARDKAKAASGAATDSATSPLLMSSGGGKGNSSADLATQSALHQHLLVEFALTMLQSGLKKGVIPLRGSSDGGEGSSKSVSMVALLNPLLPLLVTCLSSRHSPNVTASLQCLTMLIQAELPGLHNAARDTSKAVTGLLKKCPKTTHPIAQDCFKLLAGMLRRCQEYAPTSSQLRFLLGWAFTDLEESAERQTAFALLRAILSRKIVLPEVYDLMNKVQELMVRSQSNSVRQLSAASLLQFLLDYPLGTQRLQQHVQFLLINVSYDHEQGRVAALDMLDAVVTKFPVEVISNWAEMV